MSRPGSRPSTPERSPRGRRRTLLSASALGAAALVIALLAPASALATYPDRASALSAYEQAIADTKVPTGWTGSVASCNPGTESAASLAATLRTLNILRKFAGVPPVVFNSDLNQKALRAALIMHAQNDLSHEPPSSWKCWTQTGRDAAERSSLALGYESGASSVIGYVDDEDFDHNWNSIPGDLGHRRDMLNPASVERGSGSTGGANALHGSDKERPVSGSSLVAWPSPGWFPAPWVFKDWSVSIGRNQWEVPAADKIGLSSPRLGVKVDGSPVATSNFRRLHPDFDYGYGVSLGWRVALPKDFEKSDHKVEVTITGVTKGGQPFPVNYTVNTFAPGGSQGAAQNPALKVQAVKRKGKVVRTIVRLKPQAQGRVRVVLRRLGRGKKLVRKSTAKHELGTKKMVFKHRMPRAKLRVQANFLPAKDASPAWRKASHCVRANSRFNGKASLRKC